MKIERALSQYSNFQLQKDDKFIAMRERIAAAHEACANQDRLLQFTLRAPPLTDTRHHLSVCRNAKVCVRTSFFSIGIKLKFATLFISLRFLLSLRAFSITIHVLVTVISIYKTARIFSKHFSR